MRINKSKINKLDSNNLDTIIYQVCDKCGIEANRLTCLEKYKTEPKEKKFMCSTYHRGKCDVCGKYKYITETRDFFYPDFSLLKK